MKRLVFPLLALVFALFPAAPVRAEAASSSRYAVCPTNDVWFYSEENDASRLFILPYTYYVRVVYEGDVFSAVEYLADDAPYRKIYGYCRTEKLQFVDFVPERPYLRRELTLTYKLDPQSTLGDGSLDTVERTCVYYGHRYENSQLHFYVNCGGKFSYIAAEKELEYDYNTDYLLPTVSTDTAVSDETGLGAGGIVAICLVCLAAVAIAVFVLRGKRAVPAESEHDF